MEPPADSDRWLRAWDENENAWYWYDVHGDLDSVWETDDGAADDAKPETAALPENPPPPPPPPPQRSRAPARPADPPPSLPRASAGATAGGVRAAPLTFDAISGPEREEMRAGDVNGTSSAVRVRRFSSAGATATKMNP